MGGEEEDGRIWAKRKNKGINKATIVALRGHLRGKLMMRSEFGRLKDDPASTGINLAVKNGEECAGKEGRTDGEILTGDFPPDLDGGGIAKNERMREDRWESLTSPLLLRNGEDVKEIARCVFEWAR